MSKCSEIETVIEIEFVPDEVYGIDKLALVDRVSDGICDALPTANPRKGNNVTHQVQRNVEK